MHQYRSGFTLMELLLVTAITGIILGLAAPHLGRFINNQRLSTATQSLQLAIMYGRAVAISKHQVTVLCPSTLGEYCDNTSSWHKGWIYFHDQNGDRERQNREPLLRVSAALEGVQATSSKYRKRIRFLPNGSAAGSAMTISVCPSGFITTARGIVIANSGRIRQTRSLSQAAVIQCLVQE